ncbi:tyrosine-type recombinase/integrase [Dubosiella newyorkensis]|uniref:tyrosine-type recombinase/integrase n=1 Tax=Dubosiella newyorkensis TaxID=1862672 RepID=UPI0023F1F259|nr:site-specific integrase [Dubosiella newyorkensis]
MAVKKNEVTGEWGYYGTITHKGKVIHRYKKRGGFKRKGEAIKAEQAYRENFDVAKIMRPSLVELVDQFLPFWKTQVKPSTADQEEKVYKKLIRELGDKDFYEPKVLQAYINECDSKYSKRYVEKIYFSLTRLFKFAVREEIIETSPMVKVYKDARAGEQKKEMSFFEPDEFKRYLSVIEDPRDRAMFSTLYWMGIRKGEMMGLQWKDIDFKNKTISISKTVITLNRLKDNPCTPPKTKNSYRTISMPKSLIKELDEYLEFAKTFTCFGPEMFVFGDDKPISAETLRRKNIRYIKEANRRGYGIPEIRIHDFRHSHASYLINNMAQNGFSDFDIAKRLGDTVETIHSVYAHWFKAGDDKIIDFMDNDN